MDLHAAHMGSHLMAPEMEVSMMPPLEDHGLTTITVDSTLEGLPPQPLPPQQGFGQLGEGELNSS